MVQELQSYAVSEGEGKYETVVSHGYIGYGINVALAHEGLSMNLNYLKIGKI